jgi:hypothetical protein
MIAQSAASLSPDAMNFATAQAFGLPEIEDASFETIIPGAEVLIAAGTGQAAATDDQGFAIFTTAISARRALPGFGYWLFVALAALSAFWIAGGHVLFVGP